MKKMLKILSISVLMLSAFYNASANDDVDYVSMDEPANDSENFDDGSSHRRSRSTSLENEDSSGWGEESSSDKRSSRRRRSASSWDDEGEASSNEASKENDEFADVSYKNMDSEKFKAAPPKDFFAKNMHIGAHAGFGYVGTWNNQKAYGNYSEGRGEKDPYDSYLGFGGDLGMILNYHLNRYISVVPELNFRLVMYTRESDSYYLHVESYDYDVAGDYALDENLMLMYINIPLALRVTPAQAFYAELGAEMSLNVHSTFNLSNDDFEYDEDVAGAWSGNFFGMGLLLGAGTTIGVGDVGFLDLGARFILDLTRIEEDELVDMRELNGTYREGVATRMWAIQLVCNMYFL